jgi:hypothetical protein
MCIMDAEGASTHRPDVLATGDTNLISYLLELAKQGCDKMIVYAPTENEARRVMNVARRFDKGLQKSTTGLQSNIWRLHSA